jgi:hypothetical protein
MFHVITTMFGMIHRGILYTQWAIAAWHFFTLTLWISRKREGKLACPHALSAAREWLGEDVLSQRQTPFLLRQLVLSLPF